MNGDYKRPPRPTEAPFRLRFRMGGPGLPEPGTTNHALMILLGLEIAVLFVARRYFRSVHAG
jgi:hypothetical protein